MEYLVIDNISKKYTTGGTNTKRNADDLNKMLKEAKLEQLQIFAVNQVERELSLPYIKSTISEICIEVIKRIKEKDNK